MLTTAQSYRLIANDLPRALETAASQRTVKRETKYYLDNIGKVKTIDDFIGNRRLFAYAMKAFGLEDMAYAKAYIKKALTEGVARDSSFANRLVDTRLKELVTAFNFERRGEYTTTFEETRQGTAGRYARQVLEQTAGQSNEGVRLALYFERKAATITSAFSILGDKALLRAVQVALDIPAASSAQSIDKQAALIEKRLPISSLQDPKALRAFLEKFTVKWELQNPSAPAMPALGLESSGGTAGISASVLSAMQNLKLGGI